MGYEWRRKQQPFHLLLYRAISLGDALVLPQMLEPRFNQKCFDVPSRLSCILENAPHVRAVSTPFAAQRLDRSEERFAIDCRDSVIDSYHDMPVGGLQVLRDDGRG